MKSLLLARGLHPPWATGSVSYCRGVLSSLLSIQKNSVSVVSTIEEHRLGRIPKGIYPDWHQIEEFKKRTARYIEIRGGGVQQQKTKAIAIADSILKHEDFDLIHIVFDGLSPWQLPRQINQETLIVKHIYGPSATFSNSLVTSLLYNIGVRLRRQAVKISFPSSYSASSYWMENSNFTIVVPPAIDTSLFCKKSKGQNIDSLQEIFDKTKFKFGIENMVGKSKLILHMGFLLQERFPFEIMLRSYAKLLEDFEDYFFLIVGRQNEGRFGEPTMAEKIIALSKKLNIDRHVGVALHEVSDTEKLKLLATSDVIIYPFTKSRLNPPIIDPPLGILESMATECKVVTTPVLSIMNFLVHGFNGFILKDLSVGSVVKMLREALNSNSQIGTNARKTVTERFSLDRISRILEKIAL